MIVLSDIQAQLAAAGTSLRHIGTARDFASALEAQITYPSAWIIHLSETAGENRYTNAGIVDQRVSATFGVILALQDIGGPTGAHAVSQAESVRLEVMTALGRFTPIGADSACIPRRGRLLSGIGDNGRLIWQDDYTVAFNRRITS